MLTLLSEIRFPLVTSTKLQAHPQNSPFLKVCSNLSTSPKNYSSKQAYEHGIVTTGAHTDNNGSIDQYSMAGLREDLMPKHVAISLDGNRRWLKNRGLGIDYTPFHKSKMLFADLCLKWGVKTATSFVYGISNLLRSKETNHILLGQFGIFLEDNLENFQRKGIRISILGERYMLSETLQATIKQVEEATKNNTNLEYVLPVCYSGQRDITIATRKICEKVKEKVLKLEDINEDVLENELSISCSRPHPDLFIRVGGELRIGALFSWQVAHIELYFANILAPDFQEEVFVDALRAFQGRHRKYGK